MQVVYIYIIQYISAHLNTEFDFMGKISGCLHAKCYLVIHSKLLKVWFFCHKCFQAHLCPLLVTKR